MNVYISFAGDAVAEEKSYHLIDLADFIERDCDLPVKRSKSTPQKG